MNGDSLTPMSLQDNADNAKPTCEACHPDERHGHQGWGHPEVREGRPAKWGYV